MKYFDSTLVKSVQNCVFGQYNNVTDGYYCFILASTYDISSNNGWFYLAHIQPDLTITDKAKIYGIFQNIPDDYATVAMYMDQASSKVISSFSDSQGFGAAYIAISDANNL